MHNGFWCFNLKENKFEPSYTEPMSLFPTVVEPEKKIVFCRKCHRWEYIIGFEKNILTSQCGKIYAGPFVTENSIVDYSFNVRKFKNSFHIIRKSQRASNSNRRLYEWNYVVDMENKVLYKNGKAVFENEEISGALCKEVTAEILDDMGDTYKKQFGIKPTVSSQLKGLHVIIGYMLSPFNVNFFKIAQHWGLNPYDRDFASLSSGDTPTAENEMFESLGVKPTKSLRKMYQKFPQSVICYAVAKDLGFNDVNILQKSISAEFYAFLKFYMVSFAGGSISYPLRHSLKNFTEDLLQISNEKTVWNSIERTVAYAVTKGTEDYIITDGLNTYSRVRMHLTDDEKKEVMREGFNEYTHDYLVRRADVIFAPVYDFDVAGDFTCRQEEVNQVFDIEQKFLDLEYKAGDDKVSVYNPRLNIMEIKEVPDEERFCFYVARDSKTLREIGNAMHNCVGWGYSNSVRERHCTIVYAKYREKYAICIEVTPHFTIRQSLGPCNRPLNGPALVAYHEWCREKSIRFVKAFKIQCAV